MIFKHKIVNDLAWVIGSVPLMSFNPKLEAYQRLTKEWFYNELKRSEAFLLELDKNPTELEEFLFSESKQLLGKRFEKFVEYWLRKSGRFEILMANKVVKNEKVTLGEIDFLVMDNESNEIWHLEVASKYYLGYNNSSLWKNWVGLNARDSLEDKMYKFNKQLSIFDREEGKSLLQTEKIKRPKSYMLMKGFFFYHWKKVKSAKSPKRSNPHHSTGIYLKEGEMSDFFIGYNSWVVLGKKNWFARYVATENDEVFSDILIQKKVHALINDYGSSIMLARLKSNAGLLIEDLRVVVTLNSWPH